VKAKLFWSIGVFMVKVLMWLGVCLSGRLGIHSTLISLVVFLHIISLILVYSILDLIMPLFCVTCLVFLRSYYFMSFLCILCST